MSVTVAQPQPAQDAADKREGLLAALGILLSLTLLKHSKGLPIVGAQVFTLAAALQLYFPLWRMGRGGITRESLGLGSAGWKKDLQGFLLLSALTAVGYSAAVHLYYTAHGFHFALSWPHRWPGELPLQLLAVALPEELFFRGYLQERLERRWPSRLRVRGVALGPALLVTAVVFALAHFLGEYQLSRLGPFFPGLLFGVLRAYSGNIWGAVGYHAFCNLLQQLLFSSYHR